MLKTNEDTFESLFIWQSAKDIFCDMYSLCRDRKDYYLKDQLLRAVLSISNNIAEWYERQTNNEMIRFLYIARWSAWETRSMLLICKKLSLIPENICKEYINTLNKISSGIYRLIKSRESK